MTKWIKTLALAGAGAVLFSSATVQAHRQWMMPSATVLSGDDVWVTVDAAVSNDLFYFEHQPMRLNNVKAWAPDGTEVAIENGATGRYRSTFDVHLTWPGTWKIGSVGQGVGGSYKVNGEEKRLPRGADASRLSELIPADATDVRITESWNRNELYVTSGEPTLTVFAPSGQGLEFAPVTHPNDLVDGEAATFQFLIDGQPAANLEVTVIHGGIRYRNDLGEQTLTTDAEGKVTINWQGPGMYWINASAEDAKTSIPGATSRRMNYVTTVEVLSL